MLPSPFSIQLIKSISTFARKQQDVSAQTTRPFPLNDKSFKKRIKSFIPNNRTFSPKRQELMRKGPYVFNDRMFLLQ